MNFKNPNRGLFGLFFALGLTSTMSLPHYALSAESEDNTRTQEVTAENVDPFANPWLSMLSDVVGVVVSAPVSQDASNASKSEEFGARVIEYSSGDLPFNPSQGLLRLEYNRMVSLYQFPKELAFEKVISVVYVKPKPETTYSYSLEITYSYGTFDKDYTRRVEVRTARVNYNIEDGEPSKTIQFEFLDTTGTGARSKHALEAQ
ncbi:MAG: hypothetical protein COT74_10145 [Bdellovibrionales bacterium CG10_big_fil_rev_8_21_14_0_10_45_34]|nr:MAG: hypothetical protein COT74_10145 [Bdellovibrionales bacterium CG10_big_fil_rev_8_21_14_0_10_45_34]